MKKKLMNLVALLTISANMMADGLTATLQHEAKMTPFYGVNAFKDAYSAATDGDVITLSKGIFNSVDTLAKAVKVIGNFAMSAKSVECTILNNTTITADNVMIDAIFFKNDVLLGNIKNCKIVHSWISSKIGYTSATDWHTNTVVDQCVINIDVAIMQGINYTIKNSTINYFGAMNTSTNVAYITNCFVNCWYRYKNDNFLEPYAIYKNNVLGVDNYDPSFRTLSVSSPSEFYNNCFYRINSYLSSYTSKYITISYSSGCVNTGNIYYPANQSLTSPPSTYPNKEASFGNGQDGTPIGIIGGTGFHDYPNIPRVTESTIDSHTDSDGKLNVKIKVVIPE